MSRLLADENIPQPAVKALRAAGHDVHAIQEEAPGATDEEVLAAARAESRIHKRAVDGQSQGRTVSRQRQMEQRPVPLRM